MTEYWVSQARKFCEYCKCWTADNRASIEFHEKGKRHIENVQKKITELKKKGMDDAKAKSELDRDMARMEKAALAAFKKDLEANPELAEQYGVKRKVEGPSLPPPEPTPPPPPVQDITPQMEWLEAKSPEGHSYYWNINTKATSWEKPEQFKTLEEQKSERKAKKKANKLTPTQEQYKSNFVPEQNEAKPTSTTQVTQSNDIQTNTQTNTQTTSDVTSTQNVEDPTNAQESSVESNTKVVQTSKAKFVIHSKKAKPAPLPFALESSRDAVKLTKPTAPTGISQWTTVQPVVEEPPVDLELPTSTTPQSDYSAPSFSEETFEKPKFKQKQVSSLGKRDDIPFKKRKFTTSAKNTRQKFDEND